MDLPSITTSYMILLDAVIESIIQAIRRITSRYALEKELQAAHFDMRCNVKVMYAMQN